jgi:Flp pilus assembly protein TadD
VRRDIVFLGFLIATAVIAFFFTRAVASSSSKIRRADAAAWYERGRGHLEAARPAEAVSALRRATALSRGDRRYRLALGRALAANGRAEEARLVLLRVREETPEDPQVNLRLARLAAGGDVDGAVAYYQSALHGRWAAEEIAARRELQLEFIDYLLRHGRQGPALAQLLLFEATLPDDPVSHNLAGGLFARAGDPARALAHFERTLRIDRNNAAASSGAGTAAFDLGEYGQARRYLADAPGDDARGHELRAVADAVVRTNPLAPRLAFAERRRRLTVALSHLVRRIERCTAADASMAGPLEPARGELQAFTTTLNRRRSAPSLDTIEAGVDLIARAARQIPTGCAPPQPLDRAIEIIVREHEADPR